MHARFVSILVAGSILLQAGTLGHTPPPTWKPRTPSSSMRLAEFVVPRAVGDPEDGEVVIFHFGGSGGSVDANITRWIGQFQQDPAKPAPDPGRTSFKVGNLNVTAVDVRGTYVAEVRPGAEQRHNKPNFRMRAAVVETPNGPYFVKFTGPAATVERDSRAFDDFLQTFRFR